MQYYMFNFQTERSITDPIKLPPVSDSIFPTTAIHPKFPWLYRNV